MRHSRRLASAALLFVLLTGSNVFSQETSTIEEFQELGELAVGRWIGEIKFITDWPGQEAGKGERVVGYRSYAWTDDKRGLFSSGCEGTNSFNDLIVWDPVGKKIKVFGVNTAGGTGEVLVWKKEKNLYGFRVTGGGELDGRALGGEGEWIFTNDGKSFSFVGELSLGGKKLDPLKDVYKRLSP